MTTKARTVRRNQRFFGRVNNSLPIDRRVQHDTTRTVPFKRTCSSLSQLYTTQHTVWCRRQRMNKFLTHGRNLQEIRTLNCSKITTLTSRADNYDQTTNTHLHDIVSIHVSRVYAAITFATDWWRFRFHRRCLSACEHSKIK